MDNRKKLSDAEWCFQNIPSNEMKDAFFYEYARESKEFRRMVDIYREFHSYISLMSRTPLAIDPEKFLQQPIAEQERLHMLFGNFSHCKSVLYVIDWLSFIPKFPASPYVTLEEKDLKNGREFPANIRGVSDIALYFPRGASMFLPALLGNINLQKIVMESDLVADYQSLHVMLIDWRKTNSELVDDFRDWIEMSRNLTKTKPVRESSRGIANEALNLPKECRKVDTALLHLGKLRRLESCKSFDDYMKIYHPSNIDRRSMQKDISAARAVITWLESLL